MGFPGGTVDLPGPARPELAAIVAGALLDPYGHGERLVAALRGEVPVAPGHLATNAWVFDAGGERLLLVRHRTLGWVNPGGHLDVGELPADGAARELAEETGLAEVAPPRAAPRPGAGRRVPGRATPARPTGTGTSTTSSWPTRRRPSRPRRARRWRGSRSTPCPTTGSPTWTSCSPCWSRSCGGHGCGGAVAAERARLRQRADRVRRRRAAAAIAGGPRRLDVAPLGGAAADADPQRRPAVEHGAGEQGGAGGVGRVDEGVGGGVAVDVAEAHEVERGRRGQLEAGVGVDPPGQLGRQADVAADHGPGRLRAVGAEREPHLEGPEPAAERDLPVAVVDDGAGVAGGGAQVLGQDRQRRQQRRRGRPRRTGRSRS